MKQRSASVGSDCTQVGSRSGLSVFIKNWMGLCSILWATTVASPLLCVNSGYLRQQAKMYVRVHKISETTFLSSLTPYGSAKFFRHI